MIEFIELEKQRQKIQSKFDALKSQKQRNVLGQFATPITLANSILEYTHEIIPNDSKIRFLDPAIGTGSFYSALINIFGLSRVETAVGYEVDEHYALPAQKLWSKTKLEYRIEDFTNAISPTKEEQKYSLIVCNPPYVRHHHINERKKQLKQAAFDASGINLSSLAGLYCYFIAFSHRWMQLDSVAVWLLPSEFMDVNYGQAIKEYLLNEVTLLQIYRFDPAEVQFNDALVSSAVIWFKNRKPNVNHKVKFGFGGTIDEPKYSRNVDLEILANEKKWTRFPIFNERTNSKNLKLSQFFAIKRGIATGDNNFFIMSFEEIKQRNLPIKEFRPILPSPRYLNQTEIKTNKQGYPVIDNKLFVLDCNLPLCKIKECYPDLYDYLQIGIKNGILERYICKNRKVWYTQEKRPPSNFYCTYVGRASKKNKKPFRFILNYSQAIVSNSYLVLDPNPSIELKIKDKPELLQRIKDSLDRISSISMIEEGRVYGGGMRKLEPKELGNVSAEELAWLIN